MSLQEKLTALSPTKLLVWIPIFLILYNSTANLANDIYLPSLPGLKYIFNSSENMIQLTMTFWFAGVAIPQLFFGPLTDKYGRKPIIIWGGVCFILSTVICGISQNLLTLIIARFFQGVGVCSLNVTGFSILADLYPYQQRMKIMNKLSICGITAPLIGPIIGGYILTIFGWRENFFLIFLLGLISLVGLHFMLPETNLNLDPEATHYKKISKNYLALLRTRGFLSHLIPYCFLLAGLVVYLTAAPFLVIGEFHVQAKNFGLIQIPIFGIFILGSLFLNRAHDTKKFLKHGLKITLFATAFMLLANIIFGSQLFILIAGMVFYALGFSLCSSSLVIEVMEVGTHMKGSASAVLGCGMASACVLCNAILNLIYDGKMITVSSLLFIITTLAYSLYYFRVAKVLK